MASERQTTDETFVRSLLRAQHPDLAGLSLRPLAGGWDNRVWRLGSEWAVRLPRTPRAPELIRKEQRWLPALAPRLPLPVPIPVRIGEPSASFPKPWSVHTWVPGDPGDRVRLAVGADRLAGFLRALHVPAPAGAPVSADRGVALRRLARVDVPAGVRAVWEDALAAPEWGGPPVWLHGDLHPANVVVEAGALAGVLDFGDLCAGDPAADLAAAWLVLPDPAGFFEAYGRADAATIRRARGWAVLRGLSLVDIGQAWERGLPGGQPTWGQLGRDVLRRLAQ